MASKQAVELNTHIPYIPAHFTDLFALETAPCEASRTKAAMSRG